LPLSPHAREKGSDGPAKTKGGEFHAKKEKGCQKKGCTKKEKEGCQKKEEVTPYFCPRLLSVYQTMVYS